MEAVAVRDDGQGGEDWVLDREVSLGGGDWVEIGGGEAGVGERGGGSDWGGSPDEIGRGGVGTGVRGGGRDGGVGEGKGGREGSWGLGRPSSLGVRQGGGRVGDEEVEVASGPSVTGLVWLQR